MSKIAKVNLEQSKTTLESEGDVGNTSQIKHATMHIRASQFCKNVIL